jgi:hypothetical protein
MTDDKGDMRDLRPFGKAVLVAAPLAASGAQAFDDAQYPDLKGQWKRTRDGVGTGEGLFPGAGCDPSKPPAAGQQAPLTAEYAAIFEANVVHRYVG